jgi:hypothetical protein
LVYVDQARDLFGIFKMLPDSHLWRYDTAESLQHLVENIDEDSALVATVYGACLNDVTATVLGLAWKARECAATSVKALNARRVAASAACARAGFEAATAAIDHVVMWSKALKQSERDHDLVALFTAMEASSIRGLWGRKGILEGDHKANHFLNHQRSVLKFAGAEHEEIREYHPQVYDVLCNIAHPSAEGHQYFWRIPDAASPVGDAPTLVEMSSDPDLRPQHLQLQLVSILWALGWSAAHAVRAYDLCLKGIASLDLLDAGD